MKKKQTIIYSLAGEGKGHVTAVVAIASSLIKDYEIIFIAPSTVTPILKEAFPKNQIIEVPGLFFPVNKKGRIKVIPLCIYSAGILINRKRTVYQMKQIILQNTVSAIINDFEPYTAYAANDLGTPLFHLNHPGIVLQRLSFRPLNLLSKLGAILIMGGYGTKTAFYSFYGGQVGPIVRQSVLKLKPIKKEHFLVYLNPHMKKNFLKIASAFPQYEFKFFPNPNEDYLEALRSCKAIIAPAGHQMICEALVLDKPILTFPIPTQYEQHLNAKMIEFAGRGFRGNPKKLKKSFEDFLTWMDGYPYAPVGHTKFTFSDETPKAVNLIKEFISENS